MNKLINTSILATTCFLHEENLEYIFGSIQKDKLILLNVFNQKTLCFKKETGMTLVKTDENLLFP